MTAAARAPSRLAADARPRLFVELCAGSAAVTLRLLGGRRSRPPVSYQGSKNGLASTILHVLGLRSGQGADAVLLNDPGPWSKVWRVLVDPAGARRVAEIIRGWVGEDPRALWERLRAEPVPEDEGEAAARWAYINGQSVQKGGEGGASWFTRPNGDGQKDVASFARDTDRLSRLAFPPGTLVLGEDAAGIEPRDVARWLAVQGLRYKDTGGFKATAGGGWPDRPPDIDAPARAVDGLAAWPPALVSNLDAADIDPRPPLPPGTVCYIDPPYFGDGSRKITGYAHEFHRASVVEVAERWKAAGARVAVSECVAVPELVAAGWYAVEITGERRGQKRTFGATPEFLTLSEPPLWVPAEQETLFGAA